MVQITALYCLIIDIFHEPATLLNAGRKRREIFQPKSFGSFRIYQSR